MTNMDLQTSIEYYWIAKICGIPEQITEIPIIVFAIIHGQNIRNEYT